VPSILIIHTPEQLEQASNLVDLLETSLSLDAASIACSSLPGYAWREPTIPFRHATAAIALVDESAVGVNQFWFDLAAVWTTGRRVAVVLGIPELRSTLPVQLQHPHVVVRPDRDALRTLVEDLAFDMGISPRMGRDALQMLEQVSSLPPPPRPRESELMAGADLAELRRGSDDDDVLRRPDSDFADTPPFDVLADVPGPARIPQLVTDELADIEEMPELDPLDLIDESEPEAAPAPVSRFSQTMTRLRCEVALDAGRSIAECSFHREDGGDYAGELHDSFGRFIDAIGGRWNELVQLGDVELWLGATDNLLESLPASARAVAEWYEIGFQYATLKCIAEQGLPEDTEARAVYDAMWARSMQQLWESAESAQLPRRETRRVQTQLENVIGPAAYRDYGNLAASLSALRDMARNADQPGNRFARLAGD
jgi:hypothetical protein